MTKKQKLELTWIGKEERPRLVVDPSFRHVFSRNPEKFCRVTPKKSGPRPSPG